MIAIPKQKRGRQSAEAKAIYEAKTMVFYAQLREIRLILKLVLIKTNSMAA